MRDVKEWMTSEYLTEFVVGDIVIDVASNEYALIVKENVTWVDEHGECHTWDYEVMTPHGTSFADYDDLLKVWKTKT